MSTHTAASVGYMTPFAVLTREQRVIKATARKTPAPADTSWQAAAECRSPEHDAALWYPDGNAGPWMARIQEAKDICNTRCPVRDACAAFAMTNGEPHGIWGGMTEQERAGVRRRAQRVAENRRKREREAADA